jgi:hypothetical protein
VRDLNFKVNDNNKVNEDDKINVENKKRIQYTYWLELPFKKMVSTASYNRLEQSDVKQFIIKFIRDGVEGEFGKELRRHAFTVKELKEAFEKQTGNIKYSISNFHFHINNLVEEGYIQEITRILEDRHYVSYFGRTAKSFVPIFDDTMNSFVDKNIFDPMKYMINEINPEMDKNTIFNIVDDHKKLLIGFYSAIDGWSKEMYPYIYRSKLDLKAFEHYSAHFALINKNLSQSLGLIAQLIGIDRFLNKDGTEEKKMDK